MGKHFLKIRVELQKGFRFRLVGVVTRLSLNKVHDVESFGIIIAGSFGISRDVVVHWVFGQRILAVIQVKNCLESLVLEVFLFFIKVINRLEMFFSKNDWVVNVVLVVLEKLAQFSYWLLGWVALIHKFLVLETADIGQKDFLTGSALIVHRLKPCEVEQVIWGTISCEILVHNGTGVDWLEIV